jgi:hypothetical protein
VTGRAVRRAAPLVAFAALGCDPVIDVFGSFFPAWVICLAAGVALTALARQLFALVRLEPHLGPLILIYPSLGLLFTLTVWLLFFRT